MSSKHTESHNVTSHNQVGGVTAHTVSGDASTAYNQPESKTGSAWKLAIGLIVGAIGLAASIAKILEYFGI